MRNEGSDDAARPCDLGNSFVLGDLLLFVLGLQARNFDTGSSQTGAKHFGIVRKISFGEHDGNSEPRARRTLAESPSQFIAVPIAYVTTAEVTILDQYPVMQLRFGADGAIPRESATD